MVVIVAWGKDEKLRWKNTTGQVEDPALYAKQVPRLEQERLSGQEISFPGFKQERLVGSRAGDHRCKDLGKPK